MKEIILEARNLKKHFSISKGIIKRHIVGWIRAVDGVNMSIRKGETFGLVGESGCGKTTVAKMIMLIERPTLGEIFYKGENINLLKGKKLLEYRASIQMVNQDPTSSMNPRMRIRDIITEPLTVKERDVDEEETREILSKAMKQVKLPWNTASHYPHEFSGGQRQRIAIARALAPGPECIVLDEPVSALDISIRAQIMNLLLELQETLGHSYFLIAHDLAVVKYLSNQVGVMYLGRVVEVGESGELYRHPAHPYTEALLASVLPSHPEQVWMGGKLEGEVPSPIDPPGGCHFHPRCPRSKPKCVEIEPDLIAIANNHKVACWNV